MPPRSWTENELLIALGLYCKLPFGKLDQGTPLIQQVAQLLDRTAGSVAMKLNNLASLDPVITESGRRGLTGASALDRRMWDALSTNPGHWMPIIEEHLAQLLAGDKAPENPTEADDANEDYRGENVLVTSTRRRGQNLFRDAVFSAYQARCCITGVSDARLLIASHIKPWKDDENNRLNPRNGLCLSALVDRAFDKGLITLSEDHRLVISSQLATEKDNPHIQATFYTKENQRIEMPGKFSPDPELLAWHREHIFLQ